QRCRTVGPVRRKEAGAPSPVQNLAGGDLDRQGRGFADEAVDEGRGRPVIDLVRRTDLFDIALAHDHEAVGELERLLLVMGDEHGRVAGGIVDLTQPSAQVTAHLGIERAEGLVEQQYARFDGERPRQGDALALAAGELVRIAVAKPRQLHEIEQLRGSPPDLAPREAVASAPDRQAEADIVEHVHMAEQRIVLEDEADIAFLDRTQRRVAAAEPDAAGIGTLQSGDQAQQGGLAGAGRAEQGDQFARTDVERHVMQGGIAAELLAYRSDGHIHDTLLLVQWPGPPARSSPKRYSSRDLSTRVTRARPASSVATAKAPTKLYSL